MWVSKKKLKEIEDRHLEIIGNHMRVVDRWCREEKEKADAARKKYEEWQAKVDRMNQEHHALVEKFLGVMVECLKK
jgi:hypothetical protein